ncbi:MAG TPA: hypothetical protein VGK10_11500 [Prolixibacteraceae bacterium]|jgi:uncharacterized lipoprotein YajG
MKDVIICILMIGFLILACTTPSKTIVPVNPHATPEARNLLDFLYSINGKYTLTGPCILPSQAVSMMNWFIK